MFEFFKKKPKYRLKPDSNGTYMLESYDEGLMMYMPKKAGIRDKEQGLRAIENLERENIYIDE